MNSTRSLLFQRFALPAATAVFVVGLVGCGSRAPAANPNSGTAATAQSANAETKSHGPPATLLGEAERLPDLTPDQTSKLQAVRDDLKGRGAPLHDAAKQIGELLAKSLDAGKLDQVALDAKLAEVDKLVAGLKSAITDSLNQLHALLTPAQRATVVANVDKDFEARHDHKDGEGDEPGEGPEGGEGGPGDGAKGGAMHGPGSGPMKKVFEALALTSAQKSALQAKLESQNEGPSKDPRPQMAEMMARVKAMRAAFVKDDFDAKAFDIDLPSITMRRTFGEHLIRFVAAAMDILDPAQRAKLAAIIREHEAKSP